MENVIPGLQSGKPHHRAGRCSLARRTDPAELSAVKSGASIAKGLANNLTADPHADGQSVGLSFVVDVIRRNQRTCAVHVIHDHRWVSWNMLGKMSSNRASVGIVAPARRGTDDESNGFALIKVAGRGHRRGETKQESN